MGSKDNEQKSSGSCRSKALEEGVRDCMLAVGDALRLIHSPRHAERKVIDDAEVS